MPHTSVSLTETATSHQKCFHCEMKISYSNIRSRWFVQRRNGLGRDQEVHLRGILSPGRSPQVSKYYLKPMAAPTSFNVPNQHALFIIVKLPVPVGPVFGPFKMVRITVFNISVH
jgi:hypothetical protein